MANSADGKGWIDLDTSIVGIEEQASSPLEIIMSEADLQKIRIKRQTSQSVRPKAPSKGDGQHNINSSQQHRKPRNTNNEDFTLLDDEGRNSSEPTSQIKHQDDELDGIDGLVLVNATRLRPATKYKESDQSYVDLYLRTFRSLFARCDGTAGIISLALHGNLADSPFRSICWMVLLNVMPSSSQEFAPALHSNRNNYAYLQERYQNEDKLYDSSLDPSLNNPLSQAEDSPWNQHFQDGELRRVINQDVNRTSPELEFFQDPDIRKSLSNILFLFAKAHPDLSYKQGMHELLAPLYYVVSLDREKFTKTKTFAQCINLQSKFEATMPAELFSPSNLEADVFALFEALMECMSDWYRHPANTRTRKKSEHPWRKPNDESGNKIVEKLSHIQETLLKRHDPDLYTRLDKLEIYPQLYGIRWLRLLFGREFQFVDTLTLWDAIFADSCPPGLVDQITVALLMSVRDLLLVYDYTDAVSLLMKLPSNISVSFIISMALHLKDPLRFPKPAGSPFDAGTRRRSLQEVRPTAVSQGRSSGPPSRTGSPKLPRSGKGPARKGIGAGFRRSGGGGKEAGAAGKVSELNQYEKTFDLQQPRDLPDFTVVNLNDLKGQRREEFDNCDSEELRGETRQQGTAAANVANSAYGSKITLLRKLDSLKDLLSGEQLVERSRILALVNDIQTIAHGMETATSSLDDQSGKLRHPSKEQEGRVKIVRHLSVAQDIAATLTDQ